MIIMYRADYRLRFTLYFYLLPTSKVRLCCEPPKLTSSFRGTPAAQDDTDGCKSLLQWEKGDHGSGG